jgi:hypothetical protein
LRDLSQIKTGDLVDLIHDSVCSLVADGEISEDDLEVLFNMVEELRMRSLPKDDVEQIAKH